MAIAAKQGNLNIVKILLKNGANPNLKNHKNLSDLNILQIKLTGDTIDVKRVFLAEAESHSFLNCTQIIKKLSKEEEKAKDPCTSLYVATETEDVEDVIKGIKRMKLTKEQLQKPQKLYSLLFSDFEKKQTKLLF